MTTVWARYTGWPITPLRFLSCEDGDSQIVWITILRTVTGHPVYVFLFNIYIIPKDFSKFLKTAPKTSKIQSNEFML